MSLEVIKKLKEGGKLSLIDAEEDVTRKNAQSYLSDDQIKKILDAYNNFEDIQGFARVATNQEILGSGSVLSISYYVEGVKSEDYDSDSAIIDWREKSDIVNVEVELLSKMLTNDGE